MPPETLRSLIGPDTFFLLNKADIVNSPGSISTNRSGDGDTVKLISMASSRLDLKGLESRAWVTSLTTGDGMREFMAGFTKALKQRLVTASPLKTLYTALNEHFC